MGKKGNKNLIITTSDVVCLNTHVNNSEYKLILQLWLKKQKHKNNF
jgi:hypothetical protein